MNLAKQIFLREQWDQVLRRALDIRGLLGQIRQGDPTPIQMERLDELDQVNSDWLAMLNEQGRVLDVFGPARDLPKDPTRTLLALRKTMHGSIAPVSQTLDLLRLLRQGSLTAVQADHFDRLEAVNSGLLLHLKGFLEALQASPPTIEEAPVRMEALANRALSHFRDKAERKGLRLSLEMSPSLPADLLGDEVRIAHALVNYVSNAVKFTERGSITVRVRQVEQAPQSVLFRFEVEDTGIGIAPDKLSRLFSLIDGVSLAVSLAITKRLAQLMGGDAGADSTPGVGSTFWFTVRLKRGAP